jgi:hypothetical protein
MAAPGWQESRSHLSAAGGKGEAPSPPPSRAAKGGTDLSAMCASARVKRRPQSRLPRACRGSHDGSAGSPGAGRAGEVGRDEEVAVECAAGPVVAAGLSGVGVTREAWTSRMLHLASSAAVK